MVGKWGFVGCGVRVFVHESEKHDFVHFARCSTELVARSSLLSLSISSDYSSWLGWRSFVKSKIASN